MDSAYTEMYYNYEHTTWYCRGPRYIPCAVAQLVFVSFMKDRFFWTLCCIDDNFKVLKCE